MSILHLEVYIDSEVQPELFAKLTSLERLGAREERLRQLAATGLIWEFARLHTPALAISHSAELPGDVGLPRVGAAVAPSSDTGTVDAGMVDDHPVRTPADVPMLTDIVTEAEADVDIKAAARAEVPRVQDTRTGGRAGSTRLKRMKELGLFQNG
jgi:hypothetical protein